jgi:hypothetical protein
MTDIVERLRDPNVVSMTVRLEAAAEIERLCKRYKFQVEANRSLVEACGKAMDDNARLRAALYRAIDAADDGWLDEARRALEPKP